MEVHANSRIVIKYEDGWPRYYFDLERAKLEIAEWLKARKQEVIEDWKLTEEEGDDDANL